MLELRLSSTADAARFALPQFCEERHIQQGALTRRSGYQPTRRIWVTTLFLLLGVGAQCNFGYHVRIKSWPAILMVRIKHKPCVCNPNHGPHERIHSQFHVTPTLPSHTTETLV
ncbi:hypothetical protein CORC01_12065 [Colletotrichum orchidophilum]|uniref:Uncharacterized protein n=1 Tax=Colletotrichum orchidophilum TaxID=1209926 RepID=A0A1G4ATX1_9PEZI|nr:uncharacterized protein CORC01_12065 [Colletotrichum orchidophilum]OHE92619.1 hypothetical protein CORC01_12065 [Colletotrichum orchidophilum]